MQAVEKPWGHYQDHVRDPGGRFVLKELIIAPWKRLSLQVHGGRREVWYVIEGEGHNEGDAPVPLRPGSLVTVGRGEVHRLAAGQAGLRILELQVGCCTEDDITRIEDDHGR